MRTSEILKIITQKCHHVCVDANTTKTYFNNYFILDRDDTLKLSNLVDIIDFDKLRAKTQEH